MNKTIVIRLKIQLLCCKVTNKNLAIKSRKNENKLKAKFIRGLKRIILGTYNSIKEGIPRTCRGLHIFTYLEI